MKILIIGATGNLGALTAAALTAQHPYVELRLTSHRPEGRRRLRDSFPQAEVIDADWYQPNSLVAAVRGIDKVLVVTPDFTTDEYAATPNLIHALRVAGGGAQVVRLIALPPGFTIDQLTPAQLATCCGAAQHVVAKPLLDASELPVTYVNVAAWIMFNLPWFLAPEIRSSRRLMMPAAADAARQWVAENDVADVFVKILSEPASQHVGREYLLTTPDRRYSFPEVAALIGELTGQPITYVDDEAGLRASMDDVLPKLMEYFSHETHAYASVPATRTVEELLARPQLTLRQYIERHLDLFI
jgi:NAD(P)H dehydrogenase (quinone)